MKLWLDDERPAPSSEWVRVSTARSAIESLYESLILDMNAEPVTDISLDHDLGVCDECAQQKNCEHAGTGNDVLCWLERLFASNYGEWFRAAGHALPKITVHSANASARTKMTLGIKAIEQRYNFFRR